MGCQGYFTLAYVAGCYVVLNHLGLFKHPDDKPIMVIGMFTFYIVVFWMDFQDANERMAAEELEAKNQENIERCEREKKLEEERQRVGRHGSKLSKPAKAKRDFDGNIE